MMGLFGDSSGDYEDYAQKMREIAGSYNPWVDRGDEAARSLMEQQKMLMANPNFLQDMIARGWQSSPYERQLSNDVTQQMNMNAANTGMIKSPLAQRALNDRINSMTGQFMNDYIGRGMNSYGMGMQGMDRTQGLGFDALNQRSGLLSSGANADLQGSLSQQSGLNNLLGAGLTGGLAWATGGASLGMPNWGKGFGMPNVGMGGIGMGGGNTSFRDTNGFNMDFGR